MGVLSAGLISWCDDRTNGRTKRDAHAAVARRRRPVEAPDHQASGSVARRCRGWTSHQPPAGDARDTFFHARLAMVEDGGGGSTRMVDARPGLGPLTDDSASVWLAFFLRSFLPPVCLRLACRLSVVGSRMLRRPVCLHLLRPRCWRALLSAGAPSRLWLAPAESSRSRLPSALGSCCTDCRRARHPVRRGEAHRLARERPSPTGAAAVSTARWLSPRHPIRFGSRSDWSGRADPTPQRRSSLVDAPTVGRGADGRASRAHSHSDQRSRRETPLWRLTRTRREERRKGKSPAAAQLLLPSRSRERAWCTARLSRMEYSRTARLCWCVVDLFLRLSCVSPSAWRVGFLSAPRVGRSRDGRSVLVWWSG